MKLRININCPLSAHNRQVVELSNEFDGLGGGDARKLHIEGVALMAEALDEDII